MLFYFERKLRDQFKENALPLWMKYSTNQKLRKEND